MEFTIKIELNESEIKIIKNPLFQKYTYIELDEFFINNTTEELTVIGTLKEKQLIFIYTDDDKQNKSYVGLTGYGRIILNQLLITTPNKSGWYWCTIPNNICVPLYYTIGDKYILYNHNRIYLNEIKFGEEIIKPENKNIDMNDLPF